MKQTLFSAAIPLLVVGVMAGGILAGCGGSDNGGSRNGVRDANGFVTRAEEDKYSVDALVLAAREASGTAIPTSAAITVDSDLVAIRARYPRLTTVKARPLDDLKSVIATARTVSPVGAAWGQGDPITSMPALDSALSGYKAVSVSRLSSAGDNSTFVIRFTDPLNTGKVRENLARLTSPDVSGLVSVEANGAVGDGDQITRSVNGSRRVYTFSEGWGDCFAGCINRHLWVVTMDEGGTLSLEESGTPLRTE